MKTRRADQAERPSTLSFRRDELAPYQYLATFHRQLPLLPEKSLQLAVLEDGILTFQEKMFASDAKNKNLFRDAEQWILSRDDEGCFSFANVCEELNVAPSYLRRRLLRWKNDSIARQLAIIQSREITKKTDPETDLGREKLESSKRRISGSQKIERSHSDVASPRFGQ